MRQLISVKLRDIHNNVAAFYKINPIYLEICINHDGIDLVDKSKNIHTILASFPTYAVFLQKFF